MQIISTVSTAAGRSNGFRPEKNSKHHVPSPFRSASGPPLLLRPVSHFPPNIPLFQALQLNEGITTLSIGVWDSLSLFLAVAFPLLSISLLRGSDLLLLKF